MEIPILSYLQIPLQYFQSCPSKIQQSWREKFGPIFKNLQECLTTSFSFRKSVTSTDTLNGTAIKTDGVVTKTLQPEIKGTAVGTIDQQVLPLEARTTFKKLDNGFTYYIRDNAYPVKETASLRLVIRAGSTDEQEHEQGLAHFLEHLLFHETESYGRQDIKRFFESKGSSFGGDQNTHTNFNETVYKFDIPLNDPELMDKALHILREMATKAQLSDSSVEEERAVILDEISNERAFQRYAKKMIGILFEGTPYPHRYPIGLQKIIRECTPDHIRAFYKRTYLPQNMSLIAVGDFDQAQVEKLIQKHFGDIAPSSAPEIKHDFRPVQRKEAQFFCYTDPENTSSHLDLNFPLKAEFLAGKATVGRTRQYVINYLYQAMFNRRLREMVIDAECPPFIEASGSRWQLAGNEFYELSVKANNNEIPAAYKRILLELKRVREHGFLPEELESAIKNYKAVLEQAENEKDQISNNGFANEYISHFTDGVPFVDISKMIDLKKTLLEDVKLEDINAWSKVLTSDKGVVVSTSVPAAMGESVSPEILKKVREEAATETVTPYVSSFVERQLIRHIPKPGKVIETTFFEKTGVTQWILENGMHIYIRPSKESVSIRSTIDGGFLSVPFEKRAAAKMAAKLYVRSNQGGLTPSEWNKALDGKNVNNSISIETYRTTLSTNSSKKDLETAFQCLCTAFTDTVPKQEAFNAIKKERVEAAKHQDKAPEFQFDSAILQLWTQNHPHFQPISEEEYAKAEFQDAVDFLNRQFHNPGNFNLVITGDVDLESTKQLVEKYLAGIPGQRIKRDFASFNYPGFQPPAGVIVKEIEAGLAQHCQTHFTFPASAQDTNESRRFGVFLAGLLGVHLRDRMRFVKAENYSIACNYEMTTLPGQEKTDPSVMELKISGLPENIRELNKTVLNEIERLQTEGFTSEEVASFKMQLKEVYRTRLAQDNAWLGLIPICPRWDWNIDAFVEELNRLVEDFDEKVAHDYLKKLFPLSNYVQVTQFPKKSES